MVFQITYITDNQLIIIFWSHYFHFVKVHWHEVAREDFNCNSATVIHFSFLFLRIKLPEIQFFDGGSQLILKACPLEFCRTNLVEVGLVGVQEVSILSRCLRASSAVRAA